MNPITPLVAPMMAAVPVAVWQQGQAVVEGAATAAFALSGVFAAARQRMDAVGVTAVAFLAAFGGGTLRDLLLDRRPFFWVSHPLMLWGVLALAVLALALLRARHRPLTERAMLWPDTLGLGLFAATGTQLALDTPMPDGSTLPALAAVLMGVVTAVFGGVLRDVVCNEIPQVFHGNQPYAICAFIGGWVLVACNMAGLGDTTALLAGATTATLLRAATLRWDWRLPVWQIDD